MTFEWPIQVFWEDTDAGGVVYHANYLGFFERARTSWLRALGISQRKLKEQGGMLVVSACALKYLRPARLEDDLVVTVTMQTAGRAQFTLTQQVLRRSANVPDELLCEGTLRIGWVNAVTLRPTRIPEDLLEKMRP